MPCARLQSKLPGEEHGLIILMFKNTFLGITETLRTAEKYLVFLLYGSTSVRDIDKIVYLFIYLLMSHLAPNMTQSSFERIST